MIWQCHLYIQYIYMYTAAISLYFNSKLNINCTTYIYIFHSEKIWLLFVAKRSSKIGFHNETHITHRIHITHTINTLDAYILQKLMTLIYELWYTYLYMYINEYDLLQWWHVTGRKIQCIKNNTRFIYAILKSFKKNQFK